MSSHSKTRTQFAQMLRVTMETPAWRALSSAAQSLYPWLKLGWKGPKNNNNGKIQLSNRQAAKSLDVGIDTASRAFHDLQAKGFLVVTRAAVLGVGGDAKSPCYELTELPLPQNDKHMPRKLYLQWKVGNDFPFHKSMANNPTGRNGRQKTGDDVINLNDKRRSINGR